MASKLINLVLLLAAMVGVYFALDAGLATRDLRIRHQALAAEVGLLRITDPDKVHVLALKRDDPLDFAWQIYVPAKFGWNWKVNMGNGGSTSSSGSGDAEPYYQLVRAKFRQDADGQWQLWTKSRNSSGLMGLNRKDSRPFLQPEKLQIERAGADKVLVLEHDQVCDLLHVAKADSTDDKPIIHVRFGSDDAFRKAAAERNQ